MNHIFITSRSVSMKSNTRLTLDLCPKTSSNFIGNENKSIDHGINGKCIYYMNIKTTEIDMQLTSAAMVGKKLS